MNELELLLVRLEDMSESSEYKDVRVMAKVLKRFFESKAGKEMGFKTK